jgi:flagellar biosynthesis chaperone FliJ
MFNRNSRPDSFGLSGQIHRDNQLEIDPKIESAWWAKVDCLERLQKYQEAIETYKNFIKLSSLSEEEVQEVKMFILNLEVKIKNEKNISS